MSHCPGVEPGGPEDRTADVDHVTLGYGHGYCLRRYAWTGKEVVISLPKSPPGWEQGGAG
jgi:hypothetical protein